MKQLVLFEPSSHGRAPRWFCVRGCTTRSQVDYGRLEDRGACVNQRITCRRCARVVEVSTRKDRP